MRKRKLRELKRIRKFRDKGVSLLTEEDLKSHITSLNGFNNLSITHGWDTWVTVEIDDVEFCANKFWIIDGLKKVILEIYQYLITKLYK